MPSTILCVAEKPSIAKAVAGHLSDGQFQTQNGGGQYNKNYTFTFAFGGQWGTCNVVMTSVLGHLGKFEFPPEYRKWNLGTVSQLFEAPVVREIYEDKQSLVDNIARQARGARALFIWTDCDLEGEHIGSEIRTAAYEGNRNINVFRARFSNTERGHVIRAALNPVGLDERQIDAVLTRMEMDLRIGASMTRWQSLTLQAMAPVFEGKTISYGPCQFPTMGFIVERYLRVRNFKPETFWSIKVMHTRDAINVNFLWDRNRLFDRAAVTILFERCLAAKFATVVKMQKKPTSKWKPLPLTTVELQKLGSMFLRMDSSRTMKASQSHRMVAEDLYVKGWISYPRTETDQFPKDMDLRKLIEKQVPSANWGTYAQSLLNGGFCTPRSGRNNDQAHPPIHPVNFVTPNALESDDERRLYEFVTRRFLGACSDDAKGETSTINLQYGTEEFHASGLLVLQRNYLDVYTYDRWTSSQELPRFTLNERFEPTEANMISGKTGPPGYLTEPELIALMDANGIGTDATIADHIRKVQERDYVGVQARQGGVKEFIPTRLGVGLIEGYDKMGLVTSLGKPFLRRELELKMREICQGTKTKREVLHESIEQYYGMYMQVVRNVGVLKGVVRRSQMMPLEGEEGQGEGGPKEVVREEIEGGDEARGVAREGLGVLGELQGHDEGGEAEEVDALSSTIDALTSNESSAIFATAARPL